MINAANKHNKAVIAAPIEPFVASRAANTGGVVQGIVLTIGPANPSTVAKYPINVITG